jgi:hypothetical protein
MMESTEWLNYISEPVTYNGLPVIVADEDLMEHLQENGYDNTIDINDFAFEYLDWAKENVDE